MAATTIELEEIGDRYTQSFGNSLQCFKRRGIDSAFHEAQKVHRQVECFSEPLLSHSALHPNLAQTRAELFS